jgi:hypothetical protein
MRQASMTMSWLAEKNATLNATAAVMIAFLSGCVSASAAQARASSGCTTSSQKRRRPIPPAQRGGVRSNSGDHRNFST